MPKVPKPGPLSRPLPPGQRNGTNGNGAGPAELAKEAGADTLGWIDERTGGGSFLTGMLYRKVPKGTKWFYTLGSTALFAFVLKAGDWVFLAIDYESAPTQAYCSSPRQMCPRIPGAVVPGMRQGGARVMIN